MSSVEVFVAKEKLTHTLVFVKKFKDFKTMSSEFRECVLTQIDKTLSLQKHGAKPVTVRILKHLIADSHLYVVMQQCQ